MEKEIEFKSNGEILRGKFFLTDNNLALKKPIVIMLTGDGLSGSKSSTWTLFQKKFQNSNLNSFIFDFQGLGLSDGPTPKLNLTIGLQNLIDAVKLVSEFSWVDNERIGLLGSSFGGNIALLFFSKKNNIKLLGLKSPVSFYPEAHELTLGEEGMRLWKSSGYSKEYGFNYSFYLDGFNYNTYAIAKNITIPCLIVHGDADTIVPVIQSKRLFECLPDEKYLKILPGVNHGYEEGDSKETMVSLLVSWFVERL